MEAWLHGHRGLLSTGLSTKAMALGQQAAAPQGHLGTSRGTDSMGYLYSPHLLEDPAPHTWPVELARDWRLEGCVQDGLIFSRYLMLASGPVEKKHIWQ